MSGYRQPGPTGRGSHSTLPVRRGAAPPSGRTQQTSPHSAGFQAQPAIPAAQALQLQRIVVVFDPGAPAGQIFAVDSGGRIRLRAKVEVGSKDFPAPVGTFHASHWERKSMPTRYGSHGITPWRDSPVSGYGLGSYRLQIEELEARGICLLGAFDPPLLALNAGPVSPAALRLSDGDCFKLYELVSSPKGLEITISMDVADIPQDSLST